MRFPNFDHPAPFRILSGYHHIDHNARRWIVTLRKSTFAALDSTFVLFPLGSTTVDTHPSLKRNNMNGIPKQYWSLRHCIQCGSLETRSQKLRKCGGCAEVLYCGTRCQRNAWPQHKQKCGHLLTALDASIARFGYSAMSSVKRDLVDFVRAHWWALAAAAKSELHKRWDDDRNVPFERLPRWITFSLKACEDPEKRRNPATRFLVANWTFRGSTELKRSHPTLAQYCEREHVDTLPHLGSWGMPHTYTPPEYDEPERIGSLLFEFVVPQFYIRHTEFCPLLAPHPCPLLPERRRPLLDAFINFCMHSTSGYPLRPLDEAQIIPVPGRFVRSGGLWIWRRLFTDWETYVPGTAGNGELDLALSNMPTGLDIAMVAEVTARI
ncbi:hypothetical protein C8Q80DRAFT_282048 [Daedaleopsis nitida]|nr:hypothetical protein C8Q80DRAFT_282048 [Daedaleopsis nitida]